MTVTQAGPFTVQEGGSVSIECIAEGSPPPTIHWEGPVAVGMAPGRREGSAVMRIDNVTPAHAGTYTCVAVSEAGRSDSTVELIGAWRAERDRWHVDCDNGARNIGNVKFECLFLFYSYCTLYHTVKLCS